ncbi:hypothetical protein OH809_44165 (plasmid) [Streptomyces sp. NBC_00873]|uniref:hypothetical protein n=1 Tax=Streptomyces sp. NBC_00873 TaxID=2975852 RepID=UPI002F91107D|nr:hypothetical protein OH809_44165 [Streptomyces sp. NBC_00873]
MTTADDSITQQRDDVHEIAEPPLLAPAPEPPLPPETPDRTEEALMATPTTEPAPAMAGDPIRAAAEASRATQLPAPAPQAVTPAGGPAGGAGAGECRGGGARGAARASAVDWQRLS